MKQSLSLLPSAPLADVCQTQPPLRHTIAAWWHRHMAASQPCAKRLSCHGELAAHEAMTLRIQRASVLEVLQQGLWLTVSGYGLAGQEDVFLQAGQRLHLSAGSKVVLQAHLVRHAATQGPHACGARVARFLVRDAA